MGISDSYLSIENAAKAEFTEQRSRFISFAWPVTDVNQVKPLLDSLQKDYYDARHICYAYMIGADRNEWRANDNGEPSGTAGKPILGQINSAGLSDILIAVVRYFGGVKLGTSGLIQAYKLASKSVIENAVIIEKHVTDTMVIYHNFSMTAPVMRFFKELDIVRFKQDYGAFEFKEQVYECKVEVSVRLSLLKKLEEKLTALIETAGNKDINI